MNNYLDDLTEVANKLADGQVILSPTDTIWGLGCNALSETAVAKISKIKGPELQKPFVLLVSSIVQLKSYVKHVHPRIETLLYYHERPLTVLYEAGQKIPQYLRGENDSIAIRVTKDPMMVELIDLLQTPLLVTSACVNGQSYPVNYNEISNLIVDQTDYVFHTGRNSKFNSSLSMLIKFDEDGELIFLRK